MNTGSKYREFSSGDAMLSAFGQEVAAFKKVGYNTKQEGTLNKTGNNRATSYSLGEVKDEFKLELYMSQILDWQDKVKADKGADANLIGSKVTLSVTYTNEDLRETTDVITFVILSNGREVGGGADGLAHELETLCLDIQYDVK